MIDKCAAILVDEVFHLEFPMYPIEEDKASIEQVFEDISRSTFAPEQKTAMLGYLRHKASEILTADESAAMFGDIEESSLPASIAITQETYPLIYKSLEQLAHMQECDACDKTAEPEKEETEAAVVETEATEEEATQESTETPEVPAEETVPTEEAVDYVSKIVELEKCVEAQALKIDKLSAELVAFKAKERDEKLDSIVEMLTVMQKPLSLKHNANKEAILEALSARTPESLSDLYTDLQEEYEDYSATTTLVVPEVSNPTVGAPEAADLTNLTEQLHSDIEEDDASIETYKILLGEDRALQIFQVENTKKSQEKLD